MKIAPYREPKVHIEDENLARHAIRMSNRQLAQLRAFESTSTGSMDLESIAILNQNTLGSCRRRQWVAERGKRVVGLTVEGRQVIRAFLNAEFTRKVASTNFSSYLNLDPPEDLTQRLKYEARHPKEEAPHRKKPQKGRKAA